MPPPATPETLRATADEREAAGREALDRGDTEKGTSLVIQSYAYRTAADELEKKSLPVGRGAVSVSKQMTPDAVHARNLAIAASRMPRDKLAAALRKKMGMSLNQYSRTILGIAPATLYKYRHGDAPVPKRIVEIIRRDSGFDEWIRRSDD